MERYYIDTHGNDYEAYSESLNFALQLANENPQITKVIFLIGSKTETGWFQKVLDRNIEKKIFTGIKFNNCNALFKFETRITFKDNDRDDSVIVISCGLNAEDLYKIDDYSSISSIIAIPWLQERTLPWIKTWSPKELRGNQNIEVLSEPSDVVQEAMKRLTSAVNLATALTNPNDEELAKTYVLALHKYEPNLDADVVSAYLKKSLNWDAVTTQKIEKMINILNSGKFFKGGTRIGLKNIYKQWKDSKS